MSIRPSYRKRSVVQVLADGMDAHPPTGRSCCEEAALTASELDAERRLRASEVEYWSGRAGRAESELDEARSLAARNTVRWSEESAKVRELTAECGKLRRQCYAAIAERDDLRGRVEEVENERIELQAKLDAAENRPTLNLEAVVTVFDEYDLGRKSKSAAVAAIMALAPAEGWPEWLGPRPVLRVPVRNADGNWTFHDGNATISGIVSENTCREAIEDRLAEAVKWAGILSAIESEQAAADDEDQRVEGAAHTINQALVRQVLDGIVSVEDYGEPLELETNIARLLVDAGWTPPESEA